MRQEWEQPRIAAHPGQRARALECALAAGAEQSLGSWVVAAKAGGS